jgi:iron complex transport system substrate-binding protein
VEIPHQQVETLTNARVISLSGFISELLYELGLEEQVIARDVTTSYPESMTSLPNLGHISQLNSEAILALQPDVVILEEAQLGQFKQYEQLQKSNITIITVPTTHSLSNAINAAEYLKQYISIDEQKIVDLKAQIIADSIDLASQLATVEEKAKVLFIYARGAGRLMVAGTNTSAAAIIEKAGAQNAISSFDSFKPLTPEALIEASPDVILMFKSGLASLDGREGLEQIVGIPQTPAYQNNRIIAMDGHYLTAFGPRASKAALELFNQVYTDPL